MDNFLANIIPFLFIFVAFYFLIIRPQQKKALKHQELMNSIKVGDLVVISSGIHGKVSSYEKNESFFYLEVSKGVSIKIEKQEINQKSE